jgi:FixJ family two-component response regulator
MTTIGLSYSLVKRSTKCAPALRAQAIELGAKAFITKPFDQTKMLSCISEILNSIT